jgi:hypothetical protein
MAHYYEFSRTPSKGIPAVGDVAHYVSLQSLKMKGVPATSDTCVYHTLTLGTLKGVPGGTSAMHMTEATASVVGKGAEAVIDRAKFRDLLAAVVSKGVEASSDHAAFKATTPLPMKGIPAGLTGASAYVGGSPPVVTRGIPTVGDLAHFVSLQSVTLKGIPANLGIPKRYTESGLVTMKGVPAGSELMKYVGSPAPVVMKGIAANLGVGKAYPGSVVSVTMKGVPGGLTQFSGTHIRDLITAVRANAKATLTELVDIVEALPEGVFSPQTLPYLVILMGKPTGGAWAVNDVVQIVPCDILYVSKLAGDSLTDSYQRDRARLAALEVVLLTDFRQLAGTSMATANDTS